MSSAAAKNQADKTASVVTMQDVSKIFSNGTLALSNMSLDVKKGEFLSLLGPSGCGKSTALRIVAGLGEATSGTVEWPSSNINAKGLPEGDIGFVFQEPTLMPWQTVFGNVYLPLRLRGISKNDARARIMETLDNVGLADFSTSYPRELSGGMKMRVSVARALVTKPKLLLMDEPFAALDEITRHRLNDDIAELWRATGVTIIFVTHSVYESAYLSSRIVVMRARPGGVFKDITLDKHVERGGEYRSSDAYHAICEQVSTALQEAIAKGEAAR